MNTKIVNVKNVNFGDKDLVVIGGPCSVESFEQIFTIAEFLKKTGVNVLRGGTFKPRSSPYSFQGLKEEGLKYLKETSIAFDLPIVSELTSIKYLDLFAENVDIIQIGARNMQNFDLLKEVGKLNIPIILKRGFCNTIEEFLQSAEYILNGGNENLILCERGIRTFENGSRFTLDISAIPICKRLSHLPIIVDPSHAAGKSYLVEPLALSALSAGANGIMVEVHNNKNNALSDGIQSLDFEEFTSLYNKMTKINIFLREF